MTKAELIKLCVELLRDEWDPIGCDCPRDEYSAYAPQVADYIWEKRPVGVVSAYLSSVRVNSMSMRPQPEADYSAAQRICAAAQAAIGADINTRILKCVSELVSPQHTTGWSMDEWLGRLTKLALESKSRKEQELREKKG